MHFTPSAGQIAAAGEPVVQEHLLETRAVIEIVERLMSQQKTSARVKDSAIKW